MSSPEPGATPLFIDTGAFYARFDENSSLHERASAIFTGIGSGELVYRPLYTSTYVLDELATLILSHRNQTEAVAALDRVLDSPVTVVDPDWADFDACREQFTRYDDQTSSFTDHMTTILAADRDVEYVFTFDPDDFRPLGVTVVPGDTGEA
jgi:predicted nucleic acid-binding protein